VSSSYRNITVFEHQCLYTDRGDIRLEAAQLESLQRLHGDNGLPYYSLIHHGIRFGNYVGVLQVGNLSIEVLPKADKNEDKDNWRAILIGMLTAIGSFDVAAPSSSSLQLKPNSILDLYFELFIAEIEYLVHRGLLKKYRSLEGNAHALKGNLLIAKDLSKNLIHRERFYVRHTSYDQHHLLHSILRKALSLLRQINTNPLLSSRIGALLLDFPGLADIRVSDSTFRHLQLNRKTEPYRTALDIARLILLNYHPDVKFGRTHVLALMFDMNQLWEQFVYISLRKHKPREAGITAQHTKNFWRPTSGYASRIRPDIVYKQADESCYVMDTKWKNLNGSNPTPEDLRQLYVYTKYYSARKAALIYPGKEGIQVEGKYYHEVSGQPGPQECALISIPVRRDISAFQQAIWDQVAAWVG
jgi:5-methylcytosine-specific restriction enzyme subunit McrC